LQLHIELRTLVALRLYRLKVATDVGVMWDMTASALWQRLSWFAVNFISDWHTLNIFHHRPLA